MTETAELADLVLPAAIWGEKTGCMTNADRTVHLALKAVEPPGNARPDLDIFLDYARRMDFRDKDGPPRTTTIRSGSPPAASSRWGVSPSAGYAWAAGRTERPLMSRPPRASPPSSCPPPPR